MFIDQCILGNPFVLKCFPEWSITYNDNHSLQSDKFIIENIIRLHIAGNPAIIGNRNGDIYMEYLQNKIAEMEKLFFLSICSTEDAEKILQIRKMSCRDFERINYIVNTLGFDYFEEELSETFYFHAAELAEKIEKKKIDDLLLEDELEQCTIWLEEFALQAQNPNFQLYLREKLEF